MDVLLDTALSVAEVADRVADALQWRVKQELDVDRTYFDVRSEFGFLYVGANFYIDDAGISFESYNFLIGVDGAASVGNKDAHHEARLALARRIAAIFEADTRCLVVDNNTKVMFRNAP